MSAYPLRVGLKRRRPAIYASLAALFAANACWLLWLAFQQTGRAFYWLSLFSLITIAAMAILIAGFARLLFDPQAGVIVDEVGIHDHASPMAVGTLPWCDIQGAIFSSGPGTQSYLRLMLHNPDAYLRKGNAVVRLIRRSNMALFGTPVGLPLHWLDYDSAQLRRIIEGEISGRRRLSTKGWRSE